MGSILDKLSQKGKLIIFAGLAVAVATLPTAIALVLINSGSLEFKNQDTEINLKGKELTAINDDNTKKLQQQIDKLIEANKELAEAAKRQKVDQVLQPQIDKVEQAVAESEIRLEDVNDSQSELKDFVEKEIVEGK